jgi:hypothetical protein
MGENELVQDFKVRNNRLYSSRLKMEHLQGLQSGTVCRIRKSATAHGK